MSDFDTLLDHAEQEMVDNFELFDPPTSHHFIPGFYCRQITMPAGFACTTKTHGKRHPFVITKGRVIVRSEDGGAEVLQAPHMGITEPGTRRILLCETETVWTTFHPTDRLDVESLVSQIEQDIMIPHQSLVPRADALNRQTQQNELP
jgi:hypothetical protein